MQQQQTESTMPASTPARRSIIGDLIRHNAATRVEGRQRLPTDELRTALPGTTLATARRYLTEGDIAAQNMREFLDEAEADRDLRDLARSQGINPEVWRDRLDGEEIAARLSIEDMDAG